MKIASAWSTQSDKNSAATKAYKVLFEKLQAIPQLMLVHSSCKYDNQRLVRRLCTLARGISLQGRTSSLGVMTESGFHLKNHIWSIEHIKHERKLHENTQ